MRVDLNGIWLMNSPHYHDLEAQVPGSVLSTLLAHNLIPDPFWGTCEAEARACLYEDYTFTRTFSMTDEQRKNVNYLFLNGIDTVAEIAINGVFVTTCRDMHLRQRVLLDNHILSEQNVISISFTSPYRYIREYNDGGLFAPCLVSLSGDVENLTVSVSNDSRENVEYQLTYQLQNLDGRILYEQALNGTIPGASCRDVLEICKPFGDDTEKDRQERLVYVALLDMQGNVLSENYQQPCRDDMVPYREPHYHICALDAEQFTIESDTFTKSVCLQPLKPDVVFSDNFFSLQKGKPKVITSNFPLDVEELRVWSVNQVVFQKENG